MAQYVLSARSAPTPAGVARAKQLLEQHGLATPVADVGGLGASARPPFIKLSTVAAGCADPALVRSGSQEADAMLDHRTA